MTLIDDFKGMSTAKWASKRSNCQKRKVGAAIFNKGNLISMGWNLCNPKDGMCGRLASKSGEDYELCGPPIHAEANAISNLLQYNPTFAGKRGNRMYVWGHDFSCDLCKKAIKTNKIKLVGVLANNSIYPWVAKVASKRRTIRRIIIGLSAFAIGTFGSYLLVSIL